MKHSPGPWHADSIDRVRTNTGIVIARCERNEHHEYMCGKEQSANARLIAASPELLEALEQFVQWENDPDRYAGDLADMIQQAKRTIAKAKGAS